MDPSGEYLAWMRAHEPGVRPPTRRADPRRPRVSRHLAGALRRMANRLDA